MGSFRFIEHTADIGISAQGETQPEMFAQAATGLFSTMAELSKVREACGRGVEVSAPDVEALLVDWLNELVYIFDVEGLVLKRFEVRARYFGERFDEERRRIGPGVKAATYLGLQVTHDGEWKARVFLDI